MEETWLEQNISEIYNALAILLVFATILFEKSTSKMTALLEARIELSQEKKTKKQKIELIKFGLTDWIVVVVIFIGSFFIMLPTAIDVLRSSHFTLLNCNISYSLFMMIFLILLYFNLVIIKYTIEIAKHYNKLCKKI